MNERTIHAGEVTLATQSFGDAADPPVLLIMGAMASMLWWPDGFCERLASHGRYVIRYDSRDTGRSSKYPVGEPSYTFDDFVEDAFRVLDSCSAHRRHVLGRHDRTGRGHQASLACAVADSDQQLSGGNGHRPSPQNE
jgi:pimeloyl-ACP methyl ester carboxylesterase